jgi:hypothetical protein
MSVSKEHLQQTSDPVRHPAPSSAPAHIMARFDQEREIRPFVLSSLQTLFLAPKLQPSHFQELPHSFTRARNLTSAFPTTSTLFVRSWARVQYPTPLLSCAPALLRKTTREGVGARALTPGAKVPGLCGPRQEALRSNGSSFPGKQVHPLPQNFECLFPGPVERNLSSGCGLYLQPTKTKSGLYLQPTQ